MTTCTEALREQLAQRIDALGCIVFATDDEPLKDREVLVKSVVLTVIRQAPLDTPACDAETAVLVVALKAYTDDSGWHAREMGPLGPTHDKLYRDGLAALLDPSPAAAVLLAQGERQRKALGHALHLVEHNKANCARCREAHKLIRAALAPREK